MIYVNMAEITLRIDNKYSHIERLCRNYLMDKTERVDMDMSVSEEEIDREIEAQGECSRGYAESICLYRKICRALPKDFNGFLLHSAVIEYEGSGYAFSAPSGTGKTTHISQWQKRFGDGVHIVNGDKPIVRFVNGEFLAYGTPWCGKEGYNIKTSVPLKALCFIERAKENALRKIEPADALIRIMTQIMLPTELEMMDSFLPLLDKMLTSVPSYVIECNISEEAAQVAYDGINML